MTNITLQPDEKGISVAVRKIKNCHAENYFFAFDITLNDTRVVIYFDKLKDVSEIANDIDRCIVQFVDGE